MRLSTYQCRERRSQFCSEEGKGNAAQETQQGRDSHKKSNLLRFQFQGIFIPEN